MLVIALDNGKQTQSLPLGVKSFLDYLGASGDKHLTCSRTSIYYVSVGGGLMREAMLEKELDQVNDLVPGLFGSALREFRIKNKISISSLSQASGITPSALFRIESKNLSRTPNRSTVANLLLSLSALSGMSVEDVYGYFLDRVKDPKQLHQIKAGKEIALRMIKISREARNSEAASE